MGLLDSEVQNQLKDIFKRLKNDVKIILLKDEKSNCPYCNDTEQLYSEVSELDDKISLETYLISERKDLIEKYNLMDGVIPAAVILSGDGKDYGIRFYGIPSYYEFGSFIETLILVSTGETQLKPSTIEFLQSLDKDVDLKIFVTPSCPYCPSAVFLGHQMAYVSEKVTSNMIEVSEFPDLGNKYSVMGVPRTVINDKEFQEGAAPEEYIIEKIKAAVH